MTSLLSASGTYLLFDEKNEYALYSLKEGKDTDTKSFTREWSGSDLNVLLIEHRNSDAHRALCRAIIKILYTRSVDQLLKDLISVQSELMVYHHTPTHAEALYKIGDRYVLTFRPLRVGAPIRQNDIACITDNISKMKDIPQISSRLRSFIDTVSSVKPVVESTDDLTLVVSE